MPLTPDVVARLDTDHLIRLEADRSLSDVEWRIVLAELVTRKLPGDAGFTERAGSTVRPVFTTTAPAISGLTGYEPPPGWKPGQPVPGSPERPSAIDSVGSKDQASGATSAPQSDQSRLRERPGVGRRGSTSADGQDDQADSLVAAATPPQPGTQVAPLIIGLIGASALIGGAFAPLVSIPIIGTVNFFSNGRGDGTIAVAIGAIAGLLAAVGWFRSVGVTGIVAGGLVGFTWYRVSSQMATMVADARQSHDLFAGLTQMLVERIEIQWGFAVLAIGVLMLLVASALGWKRAEL